MKLVVIGTGYVGLVSGACFAAMGNHVICVDKDQNKLKLLQQGISPIFEEGLEDILITEQKKRRLEFTDNISDAIARSDIILIAVGTPSNDDGSTDLRQLYQVADDIAQILMSEIEPRHRIIMLKSTVPVGISQQFKARIYSHLIEQYQSLRMNLSFVHNPEFLKQGRAVNDSMRPDRIVLGLDPEDIQGSQTLTTLTELYEPFCLNKDKLIVMDLASSEMTKYAANAFLAMRISYINEMANLAQKLGADINAVRQGIGADSRIGHAFLYPGCGYGGSCFPKDIASLIHQSHAVEYSPIILEAVQERNHRQKLFLLDKILEHFQTNNLQGYMFAIWGLSFKPGTDDLREAPSLEIIRALLDKGAQIRAYDPAAMENLTRFLDSVYYQQIHLHDDQYECLEQADAMILCTEWTCFRQPDFRLMQDKMRQHIIFDGRNQYKKRKVEKLGFIYYGI